MNPVHWMGWAALLAALYSVAAGLWALPTVIRTERIDDWRVPLFALVWLTLRYAAGGACVGLFCWICASLAAGVVHAVFG